MGKAEEEEEGGRVSFFSWSREICWVAFGVWTMSIFTRAELDAQKLSTGLDSLADRASVAPGSESDKILSALDASAKNLSAMAKKYLTKVSEGEKDPNKKLYGAAMVDRINRFVKSVSESEEKLAVVRESVEAVLAKEATQRAKEEEAEKQKKMAEEEVARKQAEAEAEALRAKENARMEKQKAEEAAAAKKRAEEGRARRIFHLHHQLTRLLLTGNFYFHILTSNFCFRYIRGTQASERTGREGGSCYYHEGGRKL